MVHHSSYKLHFLPMNPCVGYWYYIQISQVISPGNNFVCTNIPDTPGHRTGRVQVPDYSVAFPQVSIVYFGQHLIPSRTMLLPLHVIDSGPSKNVDKTRQTAPRIEVTRVLDIKFSGMYAAIHAWNDPNQ